MMRIQVSAETSASPERVLEAARDFSARRADVWPNVSVKTLDVHKTGDHFAEVTEGLFNGFFWERCRYEWSRPGVVRAIVQDSNILEPGSSWEITATPRDGKTHVDATFEREYKRGPRARLAGLLFRLAGKQLAGSDLRRALSKIKKDEPQPH